MKIRVFTKRIRLMSAGAAMLVLGACASGADEMKLSALEDKLNEALRNSAAAKIDAATALHVAIEAEKKSK